MHRIGLLNGTEGEQKRDEEEQEQEPKGESTPAAEADDQRATSIDDLSNSLGRAYYMLGVNYYLTEEPSRAETSLIKSIHFLSVLNQGERTLPPCSPDIDLDSIGDMCEYQKEYYTLDSILSKVHCVVQQAPKNIAFVQYLTDAYNYVGMIWYNRNEYERAETLFKRAEQLYTYFAVDLNEEAKSDELRHAMENMHTLTTFYLAQVYGMMKNTVASSQYCFLTLQRQLRSGLEFNKREWAKNCMGLSSFFLSHDGFSQSYHFIKAASYILQKDETSAEVTDEEYQRARANIELSEAEFYYTQLLRSKELIEQCNPERIDWDGSVLRDLSDEDKNTPSPLLTLNMELPRLVFDEFPSDLVPVDSEHYLLRTFEEALPVFKRAKSLYEKSFKFFVLDGYVSEHVSGTQQLSRMYRVLAFFETDMDRKYAMHLRRSALLSAIIDELNEQYYMDILKQISFELGEIHVECFELLQQKAQLQQRRQSSQNKSSNIKRINHECSEAIKYFNRFCGYFNKDRTRTGYKHQTNYSDVGAVEVEEQNRPAFLRAHLSLARMYYNLLTNYNLKLSEFLVASLKEYEYIIKYTSVIPVPNMDEELAMVRQMVTMLPVKIQELRRS